MPKRRTRGPNRPSGKFVRHDWMWLWMAGSKLKHEILFKSTHGGPGATPNAKVQFFSHDNAIKTSVQNVERAAGTVDAPAYDEPYDFDAEIDAARGSLDEEVKDACSVAAENLEEYRRLRQITAAQAGEAIGVNESTFRSKMRAVENMKLGEFLALCATLEVDPGVALGFIDGEDASAVRNMHRLGAVEDHRYIGEMAEFLTGKSGTYIPRHAVIPHALADAEHTISGRGGTRPTNPIANMAPTSMLSGATTRTNTARRSRISPVTSWKLMGASMTPSGKRQTSSLLTRLPNTS